MATQLRFFGAAPLPLDRRLARRQQDAESAEFTTPCGESVTTLSYGSLTLAQSYTRGHVARTVTGDLFKNNQSEESYGCPEELIPWGNVFEGEEPAVDRLQALVDYYTVEFGLTVEKEIEVEKPFKSSVRFKEGIEQVNRVLTWRQRKLAEHQAGSVRLPYKD